MLGDSATPEAIEAITEQYGLDEPLLTQYGMWLEGVFHGDFRTSIRTRMPVMYEIGMRYGNTMILAVCSIVWSVAAGMIMGIWAGTHPNKWQDNVGITVSVIGQAVPNFWLGTYAHTGLFVKLGVFPIISSGDIRGADTAVHHSWGIYDGGCCTIYQVIGHRNDERGLYKDCKSKRPPREDCNIQACAEKFHDTCDNHCRP